MTDNNPLLPELWTAYIIPGLCRELDRLHLAQCSREMQALTGPFVKSRPLRQLYEYLHEKREIPGILKHFRLLVATCGLDDLLSFWYPFVKQCNCLEGAWFHHFATDGRLEHPWDGNITLYAHYETENHRAWFHWRIYVDGGGFTGRYNHDNVSETFVGSTSNTCCLLREFIRCVKDPLIISKKEDEEQH